jgi:capsular polysaccharide transport system ATP-binding protein
MLKVENVSKVYHTRKGPRTVLRNVNFVVNKGERVGIIGPNGAGKSTFIRLIGGVEKPTTGRIVSTMSISWPIAFNGAFQASMSGLDNLRFVCRIYGVKLKDVLPFVEDFAELGVYMREPLFHYSAGMAARLAFAISMAIEFDCFLIDEVAVVGDSRFHEKCRVELFEKRKDRALVIVSHDAALIDNYCARASVLADGELKSFDSVAGAHVCYHEVSKARELKA